MYTGQRSSMSGLRGLRGPVDQYGNPFYAAVPPSYAAFCCPRFTTTGAIKDASGQYAGLWVCRSTPGSDGGGPMSVTTYAAVPCGNPAASTGSGPRTPSGGTTTQTPPSGICCAPKDPDGNPMGPAYVPGTLNNAPGFPNWECRTNGVSNGKWRGNAYLVGDGRCGVTKSPTTGTPVTGGTTGQTTGSGISRQRRACPPAPCPPQPCKCPPCDPAPCKPGPCDDSLPCVDGSDANSSDETQWQSPDTMGMQGLRSRLRGLRGLRGCGCGGSCSSCRPAPRSCDFY